MVDLLALLFVLTFFAVFIALAIWNVFLLFKVGIPGYRKLREYLNNKSAD